MPKLWTTRQRWLVRIGSLGPLGHLPASGTVTVAVVGIPLFVLMSRWPWPWQILLVVVLGGVAVWLHEAGDRILDEKDSRTLVWDEIVGFVVALVAVPWSWPLAVTAFFAERIIDIVKVWPANRIERRWPGGWGVVGDDVMAGLYTLLLLHLLMWLAPGLMGLDQSQAVATP